MKKAILAVSFGTSYAQAEETCIRPIEHALQISWPEYPVFRAFTSRVIVRKLRSQGIWIETEEEALARLQAEGYEEICVVPTHIIPGEEYERVCAAAGGYPVSAPLLADEADLVWMARLLEQMAREMGMPLVVMGHGSAHAADATYLQLQKRLPENVYVACLEGSYTLTALLPRLEKSENKDVVLMPLMLVAGSHARNELAGDGEDSWKSILEERGFRVHIRLQGLGALGAVQQRFVEKAARILSYLPPYFS